MDTLYTFWDNISHYKTESVDFLGLITQQLSFFSESCVVSLGAFTVGIGL